MPPLPDGTVTFLFTDIEGSTRLWEEHPQMMRLALARHDALIRTAMEEQNGYVFKMMGDAFCVAFHTAPDAVSAALEAQRRLHAETWPEPVRIKVRMALHTGDAEAREGDYFGPPLNRVARLLSAGHGGQVLLSQTTYDLTRDTLPPEASLTDLGPYRLRDLARPEQVFQLLHPELPSTFLPLKSLDNQPNNLPQQLTSFIGREKEMAEVRRLLAKTRLLTLTGSGGCGKTRLSLQVAADMLDDYPEGVWLVELAPLADSALVPQTVASILGMNEQAGKTLLQTLMETLKSRALLLVMDNCEHLLSACAQLIDGLMRSCPKVKILASSREGLSIAGEMTYRIPSLSTPEEKQSCTVESIGQYEAARLFIERALFHQPSFVLTAPHVPALASICYHLDGIPLAIELAAARVRSLSLEEINNKLDNRFRLLTGGNRMALPRQQTLRSLIDWSYDLLSASEKALLHRLSAFAGGWTLEAAEHVGAGESPLGETIEAWEVLDLLTSLVDKSLVQADSQQEQTRYGLLETVRQYAREKLATSGEANTIQARHRDYFLALAEAAEPQLHNAEQRIWLERLEIEHDNLRAALAWCVETQEDAQVGLRLAGALWGFWHVRGYFREGREHLERALERDGMQTTIMARAKGLHGAGTLASLQGEAAAQALLEESLLLHRELGDREGIARSVNALGNMAYDRGDYGETRALLEESLLLRRELGDRNGIAASLSNLGNLTWSQGNYDVARALYEESLLLRRELGDRGGIAASLNGLGNVASSQGEYEAAQALYEESLRLRRELGDRGGIALSLGNLGNVAYNRGEYKAARVLLEESLAIRRELGYRWGIVLSLNSLGNLARDIGDYVDAQALLAECLRIGWELDDNKSLAITVAGMAALLFARKQVQTAVRLWGAAHTLREKIGAPLPLHERAKYDLQLGQARSLLGEDAFTTFWNEGGALPKKQVVDLALEQAPP